MIDRGDLRAAIPGWLAARALVVVAWFATVVVVDIRLDGVRPLQMQFGLFAWDAAYYRDLAVLGYERLESAATRFHPLLPLLGGNGTGVLIVTNVAALLAAAAVHRLTVETTSNRVLARRAATLVSLAPPAFCLVWAYAEPLLIFFAAVQLLALHRRQWWLAALAGGLATLARPTGVFLMVPAAIAAFRARRDSEPALARAAAVAAPAFAMAGWLWWVQRHFGDFTIPLDVQSGLRDGARFPLFRLAEGLGEMVADTFGDGLHIPFAFLIVALAWRAWRDGPPEWAWYAVVSALVILSAGILNSIERYALGTIPFVVAGARWIPDRWWRPALVVSGGLFVGMTVMAWYGVYVP